MRTMIAKNCALLALSSLAAMAALGNTGVPITGIFLPPDLTDRHPGTPSCSNPYSQDYGADKAFDGNMTTKAGRWLSNEESAEEKAWLRWDFTDGAHVVGAYLLQAHVDGDALRSPKTWRFEGSNDDGGTWSVLHEVSNEGAWALGEMRLYRFGGERAFSSYRIVYLSKGAHGQVGLQEIELYPPFEAREDITETRNPALDNFESLSDWTAGGAGALSSSPSHATYSCDKLFDGNKGVDGRWLGFTSVLGTMPDLTDRFPGTASGTPALSDFPAANAFDNDASSAAGRWVASIDSSAAEKATLVWSFGDGPHAVGGYGIKAPVSGASDTAPGSWTLSGSNDGETWTLLDSVADTGIWGRTDSSNLDAHSEERLFRIADPAPFLHYRFSFTEVYSSTYFGLSEIEFYSPEDMATNITGRAWVQYAAAEPHRATEYTLTAHPNGYCPEFRTPRAWRLLGSNDGVSWNLVDARAGESVWEGGEARTFKTSNSAPFTHWRLVLDGLCKPTAILSEIENKGGYVGFAEIDIIDATGIRVTSSASVTSGGTTYNASRVFDGDTTTKAGRWLAVKQSLQPVAWLSYRFDKGMLIDGYGFALLYDNAGDNNSRAPVSWEIQGSNDGGDTWTTIDSVEDFEWPVVIGRRQFFAANPGRYREVRLAISECGPGDYVGLQEVEIYGSAGRCPSVILLR